MEPPLLEDVRKGKFVEAGEKERYRELRTFIENIDCETNIYAIHSTMPYYVFGDLPEDRDKMLESIDHILEISDEDRMAMFRKYEVAEV